MDLCLRIFHCTAKTTHRGQTVYCRPLMFMVCPKSPIVRHSGCLSVVAAWYEICGLKGASRVLACKTY